MAAHYGCSGEWVRQVPRSGQSLMDHLSECDPGQLLALSQPDSPQQTQVQCPWELLIEKEEMTVRTCLLLGANEWQEMLPPPSFLMSSNSTTAGQRSARAVRNARKGTPKAPAATHPPSFTNVGRRKFRENPRPVQQAPLCCFLWFQRVRLPKGSGKLSGSPTCPSPALFTWKADWIHLQILNFVRMQCHVAPEPRPQSLLQENGA